MQQTTIDTGQCAKAYLHYRLEADLLCLGERIRGSVFRPCLDVLTYTALTGALKARFPRGMTDPTSGYPIRAVGQFCASTTPHINRSEILEFAPRDRARHISVVPLEIQCFTNVLADVYIAANAFTESWPASFTMRLGAMKSKGFGHCRLSFVDSIDAGNPRRGRLACRLPDTDNLRETFGVRGVISPHYGYVFRPETGGTGCYVRALLEDSEIVGHRVLLQPGEKRHA